MNAATVCAYAIVGGLKGALLGSCKPTDAVGNYQPDLGSYSGPVTLEVSGGTYTDEATGNTTALSTPLHSAIAQVAPLTGGTRIAVTALTEMAYLQASAASGGLNDQNIRNAVDKVANRFGIADIVGTMPVDALSVPQSASNEQKVYALALALVSQYQKDSSAQDLAALQTFQNSHPALAQLLVLSSVLRLVSQPQRPLRPDWA